MNDQYIPPAEAFEWFRDRFEAALTKYDGMAERADTSKEYKAGMEKALRLIRYDLLRPIDGCVITMFDPRTAIILESMGRDE